jgi:hypothetical protein
LEWLITFSGLTARIAFLELAVGSLYKYINQNNRHGENQTACIIALRVDYYKPFIHFIWVDLSNQEIRWHQPLIITDLEIKRSMKNS